MSDTKKEMEVVTYKEDMIVYWNSKGEVLARVIFEDGEDLEKVEEHIYPAMMDVFGKDKNGEHIVQNSSFEFVEEWRENG